MEPLHSKKTSDTQDRGYLWLSLLIVLLLVGLLIWGTIRGRQIPEYVADSAVTERSDSYSPGSSYRHSSGQRSSYHHYYRNANGASYSRRETRGNPSDTASWKIRRDPSTSSRPLFAERKPFVFEINSADTNDLKELYGIGSYFAKAIVRYRDQLGGFRTQEQLLEVPGMTRERYDKAMRYAVCKVDCSLCQSLKVNTASLQELKRHPYLDYWQAKGIVQLREKGVRYEHPEDLLQVTTMDTATLRRLLPYLSFE